MGVNNDILGTRGGEDAIPESAVLECVMQNDGGVADLPDIAIGIIVVLYHSISAAREFAGKRFIEQLDSHHHVLVVLLCVLIGDQLQN